MNEHCKLHLPFFCGLNLGKLNFSFAHARCSFLKSLGRDQYDPTKENFVPWKSLVAGKDADFATKVAKVSPEDFNEFIKNI